MATILGFFAIEHEVIYRGCFSGFFNTWWVFQNQTCFFLNEQTMGFNLDYFRICYLVRYSGRCADFRLDQYQHQILWILPIRNIGGRCSG